MQWSRPHAFLNIKLCEEEKDESFFTESLHRSINTNSAASDAADGMHQA